MLTVTFCSPPVLYRLSASICATYVRARACYRLGTFKLLGADKIDIQRQLKANGLDMFD